MPVGSQQRGGHVEHARGGAGEGELAARAGVGAGPAGDRVHDGGLGAKEALDGDLAAGQLPGAGASIPGEPPGGTLR